MMKTSFGAVADDGVILSFRPSLVRRASSLVGPSDAEDIVQDALERALRTRTARSDRDPRPWLSRITRNVAYDALKSRARQVPVEGELTTGESTERAVLRHEAVNEIGGALETITPLLRRTIVMHDVQGYTNAEIASIEGVPYHTVRTRLFRARRALRDKLITMVA